MQDNTDLSPETIESLKISLWKKDIENTCFIKRCICALFDHSPTDIKHWSIIDMYTARCKRCHKPILLNDNSFMTDEYWKIDQDKMEEIYEQ